MMDAKSVRNMYSIRVVVNKNNTARVASCWFIIYVKDHFEAKGYIERVLRSCCQVSKQTFSFLSVNTREVLKGKLRLHAYGAVEA